jgi:hypothetical protein
VGFPLEFQQTPLEVIPAPPSSVIIPPLLADVDVILVVPDVVTAGISSCLHENKRHEIIKSPEHILHIYFFISG